MATRLAAQRKEETRGGTGHFAGRGLSCLAQIRDQSSWAPSWGAECKEELRFNKHLLLPRAQGRSNLRAPTIQRNPVPFLTGTSLLAFPLSYLTPADLSHVLLSLFQLKPAGRRKGTTHLPPRPEAVGQGSRLSKSQFHSFRLQELPSAFVDPFPHPLPEAACKLEDELVIFWGYSSFPFRLSKRPWSLE